MDKQTDKLIDQKICDGGDEDEGRMRGEKEDKQNAGQASKDYCMEVV